ncbi:unnamed protein product, partial [Iphiclides podalirius]
MRSRSAMCTEGPRGAQWASRPKRTGPELSGKRGRGEWAIYATSLAMTQTVTSVLSHGPSRAIPPMSPTRALSRGETSCQLEIRSAPVNATEIEPATLFFKGN